MASTCCSAASAFPFKSAAAAAAPSATSSAAVRTSTSDICCRSCLATAACISGTYLIGKEGPNIRRALLGAEVNHMYKIRPVPIRCMLRTASNDSSQVLHACACCPACAMCLLSGSLFLTS
ncbi:hypothetical protein Vafri_16354 [Volvox africanus]|uniref:Uncharacterized protein n=1 Tax=Volvox africanus TaxID=51714 RepID=A0A8J4F5K3_9CHLO|nr:hypothetical protein Vafri_16354 [Volvox africanus]